MMVGFGKVLHTCWTIYFNPCIQLQIQIFPILDGVHPLPGPVVEDVNPYIFNVRSIFHNFRPRFVVEMKTGK